MRIFKTKTLAKFTRQNRIADSSLIAAVERAVRGLIDANLGGHIIKQRVARPGEGKRGALDLNGLSFCSVLQRTSAKASKTPN